MSELLPIAGRHKRRPVEGVDALAGGTAALEDAEAGVADRVGSAQMPLEPPLAIM